MIETIIQYLNGLLVSLNLFQDIYDLVEIQHTSSAGQDIADTELDISFPAIYCTTGDSFHMSFETAQLYHRRNGDESHNDVDSEVRCGTDMEKTIPLKIIALFPRSAIHDDRYAGSKMIENIVGIIANRHDKSLRDTLGLYDWVCEVQNTSEDARAIWEDEFTDIDYILPSDWAMIKIEYDLVLLGHQDCFATYSCGNQTSTDATQLIIDHYCGSYQIETANASLIS